MKEKDIHWGIVRHLRMLQFRVYSTAQARASKVSAGIPDILVMGRGQHLWVEVKRPRGRMSPAQKEFRELAQDAGVDHAVWTSVEDAVEWTEAIGMVRRA